MYKVTRKNEREATVWRQCDFDGGWWQIAVLDDEGRIV